MRYLSKIVLIESANVRYSEVNVDGNVHFIGTQGVGKSTLLRALLFFYNANQLKLGIPVGKKNFADFYFPYQNSYIVYEVIRETGAFCILVFKSQGRVCFRFLDTNYDKKFFIDGEGRIFESWDRIKLALGREISYTKKVDSYEDYRNILYGNSQGLGHEFRKYSILESKQYQNIPRAIQHVFLNYKVESEFIKDTIIKSLNEEEIKIDLSNYSHHLKDFDLQLNDIKKWTEKSKSGEVLVRKQAEKVLTTYSAIKFLSSEKRQLVNELIWQLNEIQKKKPSIEEKLVLEEEARKQLIGQITDLEIKFQAKKDSITKDLNIVEGRLKDIKTKSEEYANMDIESIIQRVEKKKDWEIGKDDLLKQKGILEANFADIKQKFEAQIDQQSNQVVAFENSKHTEINKIKEDLYQRKEELTKEYDKLFDSIQKHHHEELELAKNFEEEKKTAIKNFQVHKVKIEHKRYFEAEIEKCKLEITNLNEKIRIAKSEIKQKVDEIEGFRNKWDLEKERKEEKVNYEKEARIQQINKLKEQIESINSKIENSKDSFYGWLNEKYPEWEKTIGKVIDEDNILFKSGLSPEMISHSDLTFYGVKLDLTDIDKSVKTVSDYEHEKVQINKLIEEINKDITTSTETFNKEIENLKNKYQLKINKSKDSLQENEHIQDLSNRKLDEIRVIYDDYERKAEVEKKKALENIDIEIQKTSEERINAQKAIIEIENRIRKQIEDKRKEKDLKSETELSKANSSIESIKIDIVYYKKEATKKISELKEGQKKELDQNGADTARINEIDERVKTINLELDFIENSRDLVTEYNKDKRELFDKSDFFKSQKTNFESQLSAEKTKYDSQKKKLNQEVELIKELIDGIKEKIAIIEGDIEKYKTFKLTDCYKSIEELIAEPDDEFRTDKSCGILIDEINRNYYKSIERNRELQEVINKFNGNFSSQNIFSFKTNLIEQTEYFKFAEDLKEFIDEDKISLYEKRVNELFADIIKQVGKETTDLLSKGGEIQNVINGINKDFVRRNFAGVIKSIELRVVLSKNKVVYLLTEIKDFNDENINDIGEANLFSTNEQTREAKNKKAIGLLTQLVKEISDYKHDAINLADSFELEFKVVENDNDTNWVQNLANVGSDGTDVLVKAMINIMLLNVFKEGATKNKFNDFRLHCMMDEIGKLHPTNVRGILKFANDRNINLINSSPQSFDALAYRYTYKLAKDDSNVTIINRLITNNRVRQ